MQTLPVYTFDPKYVADTDCFTFDLTAWLGDADYIPTLPSATISPSSATIETVVMNGPLVSVWISGGSDRITYTIEVHVVTAQPRNCRIRGRFVAVA